jgi:hypothetical protein
MINSVVPFQRKILANLAEWETRISELYDVYATLFPGDGALWKQMASEERKHAEMLESLNQELDEGRLFWNLGEFSEQTIGDQLAIVNEAMQRARDFNVTEHEGLDVAIHIEQSLLEAHFYSTIKSDSKVFPHIAKALTKATEAHIRKLQNKIVESSGGKVWI